MAFWGVALKPGQIHEINDVDGDVLHLSHACLHEAKSSKPTCVTVCTNGEKPLTIASLTKGTRDFCDFDLFFSPHQVTKFQNTGDSEVHLTGYFEPGMGGNGSEDMEEDSDEEIPELVPAPGKDEEESEDENLESEGEGGAFNAEEFAKLSKEDKIGLLAQMMGGEDEDEEDDSEDEVQEPVAKKAKTIPAPQTNGSQSKGKGKGKKKGKKGKKRH